MPVDPHSFWAELRRRRVLRVLAAYLAAAFIVLQAADIVLPALGLPAWTLTFVVVLCALGLPLALALSWAFDWTSEGIRRTPDRADAAEAAPGAGPGPRVWLAAAVVLLLGAVSLGLWTRHDSGATGALRADVVAVMPFRVEGADPGLAYLREGLVDLLAARLPENPRALDPMVVLARWKRVAGASYADLNREQALRVARELSAGRMIQGTIVGSATNLTVSASLIGVADGRPIVRDVSVSLPADSVTQLVDRLAAALLSGGAGEAEYRLAELTSTSLPSLRAYLEGKASYRRALYEDAASHFRRALQQDTTFALAAIGLAEAAQMTMGPTLELVAWAEGLAWAARHRLSGPDVAYLQARLGPRHPDPSTGRERYAAWEQLVRSYPDRVEAWYELGDLLFHDGRMIGLRDASARSAAALDRALELDPDFIVARQHRVWARLDLGDEAGAMNDLAIVRADMPPDRAAHAEWEVVVFQDDQARMAELTARLDGVEPSMLYGMLLMAGHFPSIPRADELRAEEELLRRHGTEAERQPVRLLAANAALNRGLVAEARTRLAAAGHADDGARGSQAILLNRAMHWDLGEAEGRAAAARLAGLVGAPGADPGRDPVELDAVCALARWRVRSGEPAAAPPVIAALAGAADAGPLRHAARLCRLLLEAEYAVATGAGNALARVQRLDSLLAEFPGGERGFVYMGNLVAAQLFDGLGRPDLAIHAVRRRRFGQNGELYAASYLREHGRIAAALGLREEAVDVWTRYLRLRENADAVLHSDVESVRQALAALAVERD